MPSHSSIDLYWSRRGDVACARHAPAPIEPRWSEEGWRRIDSRIDGGRLTYRCRLCHGSPIDHSPNAPGRPKAPSPSPG